MRSRFSTWAARCRAVVVAALCGCGVSTATEGEPVPLPSPAEIATSLFLIGDAGAPALDEPVLTALTAQVRAAPDTTVIVFLGDNIYPSGLPDSGTFGRAEAERRLLAQVEVATATGRPAYFVPGNHDWDYMGPDGWDAVRRQQAFIARHGRPWARLLPEGGCPGPATVDVGTWVRLVLLDTQWWLHHYTRPLHPDSDCPTDAPQEIMDSLAAAIGSAGGRRVVVAGHHPLASGGRHGGYFGWQAHIFPLRAFKSWLWVPLPIIGSFIPLARQQGATEQDLSGSLNQRMRRSFEAVFERYQPLVYAAGHDHDLQVIDGGDGTARHLLVSGSGIYGHVTSVIPRPGTKFAASESGFMRIDVLADGRVRLGVLSVDSVANVTERYSTYLGEDEDQ